MTAQWITTTYGGVAGNAWYLAALRRDADRWVPKRPLAPDAYEMDKRDLPRGLDR